MTTKTLCITALAGIAAGIVIQALGGNDAVPTIPPGVILALLAIAAAAAARPWWLTNLAWLIPATLLIGGLVSDPGLLPLLLDPDNEIIRAGALLTAVSELAALPLGIALTRQTRQRQPDPDAVTAARTTTSTVTLARDGAAGTSESGTDATNRHGR